MTMTATVVPNAKQTRLSSNTDKNKYLASNSIIFSTLIPALVPHDNSVTAVHRYCPVVHVFAL